MCFFCVHFRHRFFDVFNIYNSVYHSSKGRTDGVSLRSNSNEEKNTHRTGIAFSRNSNQSHGNDIHLTAELKLTKYLFGVGIYSLTNYLIRIRWAAFFIFILYISVLSEQFIHILIMNKLWFSYWYVYSGMNLDRMRINLSWMWVDVFFVLFPLTKQAVVLFCWLLFHQKIKWKKIQCSKQRQRDALLLVFTDVLFAMESWYPILRLICSTNYIKSITFPILCNLLWILKKNKRGF